MFKSKIFNGWLLAMYALWAVLFCIFNDFTFLKEHWYYPSIMVLGAFVAGLTPEGGGAVAFPVLNVFFSIDREMARDFSLMIQSIGMTSASIFILTNRSNILKTYKPMLWFIPIAFVGLVIGMRTLQTIPAYIVQALFLSLITTFAVAYVNSSHRGTKALLECKGSTDKLLLCVILLLGGICASLFGTGADIILYTLLVTRFGMKEKEATHLSIMLMAAMSVLGYGYRAFIDVDITNHQVRTWLCAWPVVLFMAPFGSYILHKMNVEWMLRGIVLLNVGQLVYFNINKPSLPKLIASLVFSIILMAVFAVTLAKLAKKAKARAELKMPEVEPEGV